MNECMKECMKECMNNGGVRSTGGETAGSHGSPATLPSAVSLSGKSTSACASGLTR